ncbi:ROK family transcriptional regulator [Allosphingosinicella deserti]|uniref:Sugar kinase n=1 Tax=Allosphingosinicella deserti TaxID=2116704 RepID=A0A2P7QGM2_9SPHN|nr:ROK family transcriptional regulator [Sphingomonas deserti]PSJ37066.1 sugar kinase [Sphingomonas deserti]
MKTSKQKVRLSGTNLERAADHNQRVTLHAIRVNGELTRVDLANITGLTPPAIANITRRLLGEGLIEESGQLRGGRGQPATKFVVARDACYSIGVNIDRDHITIVIVNFAGETVARLSREVPFALPGEVRDMYRGSIERMIADAGIDASRLVGIGVAIPDDLGRIDLPGRSPDYSQWDDANLPALFAEPLNLPVFTENDAAAAAMGEMQLGLGQFHSSFFYILVSSALGGGLVIDGNYFRGADGRSGELGFLLADDGKGGLEQIQQSVSLSGLAVPLEAAGFRLAEMMGESASAEVDAVVERWMDLAAERLTGALAAVNCLINPAAILIGGRLPRRYVEALAARCQARLQRCATNAPTLAPILRAALSEDAPAVGGAILPFSHFLLPRSGTLWKEPDTAGKGRRAA